MAENSAYDYYSVVQQGTPDTADYVGEIYKQSGIVSSWHNFPRAGNSKNAAYLAADFFKNSSKKGEYISGAIILPIILLLSILIWGFALIYLRYYEMPEHARFLSGYRFEHSFVGLDFKASRRPKIARLTFISCAICVYIFTIVYVEKGLQDLGDAKKIIMAQNSRLKEVVEDADRVTITMIENGKAALALKDTIEKEIPYFCPFNNKTYLGSAFLNTLDDEYLDALDKLNNFFLDKWVNKAGEWVETLKDGTTRAENNIESFNIELFALHWVPQIVFTTILVIATLLSMHDNGQEDVTFNITPRFQWWLKKVIMPLFIIWSVGTWVVSAVIAFVATFASDICAGGPSPGSPDYTVLNTLVINDFPRGGNLYTAFEYYITRCKTEYYLTDVLDYRYQLSRALDGSEYIMNFILSKGTIELSDNCKKDITDLVVNIDQLEMNMQYLYLDTARATEALRCERMNDIYTELFYDGICKYGANGLSWVFSSLIVIGLFSMLMVTLRSAMLPSFEYVGDDDDYDIDKDNNRRSVKTTITTVNQTLALPPSESDMGQMRQLPPIPDNEYEGDSYGFDPTQSSDIDPASHVKYDANSNSNSEQLPLQQGVQNFQVATDQMDQIPFETMETMSAANPMSEIPYENYRENA
mmetsp:Transcript_37379/g.43513  ORF Transcript_37379/g.43513 Transcript_37379/m.43513 type:complete len:642 (+) Transcript_37379:224-2149(+)